MPEYDIITAHTLVSLKWAVNSCNCKPQGGLVVWRDDNNRIAFSQAVVCQQRCKLPADREED